MSAVLADLLVRFGADSAELRKTLKTVESDIKKFSRDVEGMKSTLEGAFSAIGVGLLAERLAEMVTSGAEAAEALGKMAQIAGTSAEEMSRLAYAAKLSDIGTDELGKGLLKFSETLSKAAAGSAEQSAAFSAMGFSSQDLNGMLGDTHGALLAVAERISGYSDGTEKAAIVSALFGDRLARQMLPFLNRGAEGIADLEAEGERLGKTLSAATIEGADQFNEAMKRLSGTAEVFGAVLAANLAPSLDALSRGFEDGSSKAAIMQEVASDLADSLRFVASVGLGVCAAFSAIGKSVAMVSSLVTSALTGDLQGSLADVGEMLDAEVKRFKDQIGEVNDAIWAARDQRASESSAPAGDPQSHEEFKPKALDPNKIVESQKALKILTDATAEYQKKLATFGKGDFAQLQWELQFGKFAEAARAAGATGARTLAQLDAVIVKLGAAEEAEKAAKATRELKGELGKLQAELSGKTAGDSEYEKMLARIMSGDLREKLEASGADAVQWSEDLLTAARALDALKRTNDAAKASMESFNAMVDESVQLTNSVQTPSEAYAVKLERLQVLLRETAISQETYSRAAGKAFLEANQYIGQMVDAGVRGMSSLVQSAITGESSMEDVWKGLLSSFISMTEQMLAQWIATQIAMEAVAIGTGGAGAAGGAGPIPLSSVPKLIGMATGGDVSGGTPYIVGEKGPELFVPGASGKIIPNDQVGRGGSRTLVVAPRLLDGTGFSEWWDRNEDRIVRKLDRLSYLGRTGG